MFCRHFLNDCMALVFVVDSSDAARMQEAQKALRKLLSEEKLRGVPLMVLANKKDLPNSLTIREVGSSLTTMKDMWSRLTEISARSEKMRAVKWKTFRIIK